MAEERMAILARWILAGEELARQPEKCILVENGLIRGILSRYEFEQAKEGWPVTDLGGLTVMPGLFDCHGHLALDAGRPGHLDMMELPEEKHWKLAFDNLKKDLFSGVTTMRCMGDRYYLDVKMRDMIRSREAEGPDLLVCGIGMRSAAGHGYVGLAHTGPDEFRNTSLENIRRGADHLKIFVSPGIPAASADEIIPSFLSREEIAAVTETARMAGKKTTAHCIGGESLRLCVEEGIDVLDHLYSVTGEDVEYLENRFEGWIDLTSGIVLDEGREAYTPQQQNVRMRKAREYSASCLGRLCQSKALRFTIGTDAYHGNIFREIEYAVQMGMPRREAVLAVTVNAARMTGTDAQKGQIAPGYQADLIGVGIDPLTQENALADVRFVMKGGRVIRNEI